jgi:hypothetical protein
VSRRGAPRGRQHRRPVLLSFSTPHHDLISVEINVFHSELQTFLQAQAGTIEQREAILRRVFGPRGTRNHDVRLNSIGACARWRLMELATRRGGGKSVRAA